MLSRLVVLVGFCLFCVGCASSGQETATEQEEPPVKEVRVTFAGVEYEDLNDVKGCFDVEDFDHCLDVLRDFVQENPHDAMEAGHFIRLNANHWVAMEFFEAAARSDFRPDGFCEEEDVAMAIKSALESPDFREEVIESSKYVLGDLCWDELHEEMAEKVSGTGAFAVNFCQLARKKEGSYEVCDANDAEVAEAAEEAEARREQAGEPREEVVTAAGLEWNRDDVELDRVLVFEDELRARVILLPTVEDSSQVFVLMQGVEGAEEKPVGHKRVSASARGGQQYRYVTMRNDGEFTTVIQDGDSLRLWVPGESSPNRFSRIDAEEEEIVEAISP